MARLCFEGWRVALFHCFNCTLLENSTDVYQNAKHIYHGFIDLQISIQLNNNLVNFVIRTCKYADQLKYRDSSFDEELIRIMISRTLRSTYAYNSTACAVIA